MERGAEALMTEYVDAVMTKDPSRLAALYGQPLRVFDTWSWSFEDHGAWNHNVQDWLGSLGEETVRVGFDDVQVAGGPQSGWLTAFVTYSAIGPGGDVLRSMQNRLTWVLIADGERWIIAHEHTSAPISPDSAKAMLSRS